MWTGYIWMIFSWDKLISIQIRKTISNLTPRYIVQTEKSDSGTVQENGEVLEETSLEDNAETPQLPKVTAAYSVNIMCAYVCCNDFFFRSELYILGRLVEASPHSRYLEVKAL